MTLAITDPSAIKDARRKAYERYFKEGKSIMQWLQFDGEHPGCWLGSDEEEFRADAAVWVCRDHCGPGFRDGRADGLDSVYRTVEEDIRCGFDLIHIDLCRSGLGEADKVRETVRLMEWGLKLNPYLMFEVGTDENDGVNFSSVERVRGTVEAILGVAKPVFYVAQTGSLVREARQVGCFERKVASRFAEVLAEYDISLKEHNADYLTAGQIRERRGVVGAMNIAPQLGVVQTSTVLNLCLVHGVDTQRFVRHVYDAGKWRKWSMGGIDSPYAAALVAGHYHFVDESYLAIVRQLEGVVPVRDKIVSSIQQVLEHYLVSFGG
jgi:hypothetical protein